MSRAVNFDAKQIFHLTDVQENAVRQRDLDVIVTAGAGTGKTRTLVARYLSLLADGLKPRQVTAITFTEKAAREMRNRVRKELAAQRELVPPGDEQAFWAEREAQMDAARIGTIHSLCAEILRAHPVEAGIPPEFGVIDEGAAAALRAQVVDDTLAWSATQPELQLLFTAFEIATLERLVSFALGRRLDLADWKRYREELPDQRQIIYQELDHFLRSADVLQIVNELRAMQMDESLLSDAGPKLAEQIGQLLYEWDSVEVALANGKELDCAEGLCFLRKQMGLQAGRRGSLTKELLQNLRDIYVRLVEPWLKESPDPQVESTAEHIQPLVDRLFDQAIADYQARLAEMGALDFDDLEAGALRLLQTERFCRGLQAEIQALLVDEFQDTNQRQREMIEALCAGYPGRLFVVGDARQSIYRFRGADVTVFSAMQDRILARGGLKIDLDMTFRTHAALLQVASDLLKKVMAPKEDPAPEYWITFSPLQAARKECQAGIHGPHIELVIGAGEGAHTGRVAASRALARRLWELKNTGQIQSWEDVVLLFRASTSFPVYEVALEAAGIPFVTVAGRGFYDRPEIRDVLNLLRAVANPWDDLAVAGLLRSPAFGLTDAAIYRLRCPDGCEPTPLYRAMAGDLSRLPEREQELARRAFAFLDRFTGLADRLPVADLLKAIIDETNYRAILATVGSRLWRNLDKLLVDARQSKLVQVRSFLEYLETLREAGVREGEADVEADGAVRLMTVHKSKGLEFPVVVLADASYRGTNRSEMAYLLPKTGLGIKLDRFDVPPLAYRIIKWRDNQQEIAEEKRLLYVAATRAKEKLVASGHLSRGRAEGWLDLLAEQAGFDLTELAKDPGTWHTATLDCGQSVAAWIAADEPPSTNVTAVNQNGSGAEVRLLDHHLPQGQALYLPLISTPETQPPEDDWMAERPLGVSTRTPAPALVVGALVHCATHRWLFPGNPVLDGLLETRALNAGLMKEQCFQAVGKANELLERLCKHPIWNEMNEALERHHEVPYARLRHGRTDTGFIDLLYRTQSGWVLVDFKTETLHTEEALIEAVARCQDQVERYREAIHALLQVEPKVLIIFLDYAGGIHIQEIIV